MLQLFGGNDTRPALRAAVMGGSASVRVTSDHKRAHSAHTMTVPFGRFSTGGRFSASLWDQRSCPS